MQRSLISLLICLVAVALLSRFQAPLTDPFEMTLHTADGESTIDYELRQTVEGAEFHVTLKQKGQKFEGTGHVQAKELEDFKAGLEGRHAWSQKSQAKDLGTLTLRQGPRSNRTTFGLRNLEFTLWLLHGENLIVTTMKNSLGKGP
jgi:hypothetical protein